MRTVSVQNLQVIWRGCTLRRKHRLQVAGTLAATQNRIHQKFVQYSSNLWPKLEQQTLVFQVLEEFSSEAIHQQIHQIVHGRIGQIRKCNKLFGHDTDTVVSSKILDSSVADTLTDATPTCFDHDACRRCNFVMSSFSGVTFVFSRNSRPKSEMDDSSSLRAVVSSAPSISKASETVAKNCNLSFVAFTQSFDIIFAGELMPSAPSFFGGDSCPRAIFCRNSIAQCNVFTRGPSIQEHFEHGTLVILALEIFSQKN